MPELLGQTLARRHGVRRARRLHGRGEHAGSSRRRSDGIRRAAATTRLRSAQKLRWLREHPHEAREMGARGAPARAGKIHLAAVSSSVAWKFTTHEIAAKSRAVRLRVSSGERVMADSPRCALSMNRFSSCTDGGKGIAWEINGVTYRIDPRYRHRLGQNYDAPVAAFLRERVRPGAVCLDVGANVGVYVLQFAHWSGARRSGHGLRAESGSARSAAKAYRDERADGARAVVSRLPSAKASGEAVLYAVEADGMSRLGEPNQALAGRTREMNVPVVTLDDYCRTENLQPDWLFIDIEGFEIAALAGARRAHREAAGRSWGSSSRCTRTSGIRRNHARRAESLLAELRLRAVPLTGQTDPSRRARPRSSGISISAVSVADLN